MKKTIKLTSETSVSHPSVNFVVPNTIDKKMEAIVHLSKAIEELSRALGSVHVQATISNNHITGGGISVCADK